VAQAQQKGFGSALVDNLGPFLVPFIILILAGFTLIIYNGIAIRKKAFVKDDVVQPIMQELQNLNVEGAMALCEQYKLPVTAVLKGGLARIQDDELDIESIEKGLEETSGLELAKPFTWINLLNTVGSIAPMVGLLGTVTGMIGAFQVLQSSGMGGESSQKMAGNIGSALWTTASGLVVAIPTLISYFIYKTKFGTIVAEVNRVAGEMVFTLVRAARGGFAEGGEEAGEGYYEEAPVEGMPAPDAPPMPPA
jgi:biopolymer transport protein ExbB